MLKKIRQASVGIIVVFSALTLSACGGGSSGTEPRAQATELKPGVFDIGRVFTNGSRQEGISLLSPTGKFVGILQRVAFGKLTFSGSGEFSGPIEEYLLGDYSGPTSGTLSGEVLSSKEADLTASISGSVAISNGVLLRKDKLSDLGVTFDELSAVYTITNSTSLVTIGPTGEVTGGDRGCVFNGQVVIPDKTINVFEVTYEASTCSPLPGENATANDRNGDFSGLGTYDASGGEVLFYARNGTVAWMFKGTR
jgi:hypothetical protein